MDTHHVTRSDANLIVLVLAVMALAGCAIHPLHPLAKAEPPQPTPPLQIAEAPSAVATEGPAEFPFVREVFPTGGRTGGAAAPPPPESGAETAAPSRALPPRETPFPASRRASAKAVSRPAKGLLETDLSATFAETWKSLPLGNIYFDVPSSMKVGITGRAIIRISDDAAKNLAVGAKTSGGQTVPLKVSHLMVVKLTSDCRGSNCDFTIAPLSDEKQVVVGDYAEWQFDITPQHSGTKHLHLLVSAILTVPGSIEEKTQPVIDKDIRVDVNLLYSARVFVFAYWQWLFGTTSSACAAAWAVLRRKKKASA